jgi:hypothetical protein
MKWVEGWEAWSGRFESASIFVVVAAAAGEIE